MKSEHLFEANVVTCHDNMFGAAELSFLWPLVVVAILRVIGVNLTIVIGVLGLLAFFDLGPPFDVLHPKRFKVLC